MSEGGPGGTIAPAPPGPWLESLLPLVDAASAVVELGCVFGPVAVLFAPAPGLWAVLAGLLLLAMVSWALLARRLWAPLRAARAAALLPAERRGGASPASPLAPATYLAGTRLGFVSLCLRTALVTAVAALWGALGVGLFHLPPEGLLLVLWAAALAVPHLGSWRALLWQRLGNRFLLQLLRSPAAAAWGRGSDAELRLLRDTFQGRLVLSALACSGVFGSGAVCIVATSTVLPARGQLELWWWLPPALLLATLAWLAWLRLGTRPIDRFLDSELRDEAAAAAVPRLEPAGRARELAQALAATQQLPYALAVALWLAWTGSALLAVLAARPRFALRPTGVLQLLVPVALLMFAAAMYQVPSQQSILAPLWPRLTARALQAPGRTPAASGSLPLLLVVPVALLVLLWELLLGFGGGGQSWHSWLSGAVLIAVAGGGTWLLLRDLVRPLRALHRRAAWLTGGEFAPRGDGSAGPFSEGLGGLGASLELGARRLVAAGGEQLLIADIDSEGDEIGRLAAALTAMQRALGERLLSSAHAQLLLEQQVSARTVELQRRNEELRGALANLQRTQDALLHTEHLASVGRLVAGIAHEINNPINAVVNMAAPLREALLELAAPPPGAAVAETVRELPDMLRVIERGTRRTSEIVRALHSYADREPTAFALADVHQILAEALELLPPPATAGVAITRSFGELPLIFAHAGQLQQVFINLLSNAFHAVSARAASAAGGYVPQLELQTRRDGGWVRVAVRDNGTGIPPEVRLRIFDPFFTTKDASSGSGLGLSIVHGIVSRHGGTIAVDTAAGQGACFTVSLPVADPPAVAGAQDSSLGAGG